MRHQLLQAYYESSEYRQKLQNRMQTLKSCHDEPLNVNRLALDLWSINPIEFIEQFGWISIPEYDNSTKPFFMFDYQKKVIEKLWASELSGEDSEILVDKPRGMGLTWTIVWYQIWRWLFTQNWGGFNLSRTEAEVDDGSFDPNGSIFGKFRWGISMLPEWIKPEGFVPKGKKGTTTDMALRITNPQLSSSLVGSTTNANAGRSRRYSFIFVDECFAIERFKSVYSSLQSVARTKVFVSTVKAGRVFKEFKNMCEARGNYISLTWKDHPFKDTTWYDEQIKKAEFDPEVMKEIEVDYNVSINSQYYPEIKDSQVIEPVLYDRKRPLYVGLDQGQGDATVLVFAQWDGQYLNVLEAVSNRRRPYDWYIPFLNPSVTYNPEHYIGHYKSILEKLRTWQKPVAYFGEAAHAKAESDNLSFIQKMYRDGGVKIIFNPHAIQYEPRRKATSTLLRRTIFNGSSDGVMELYDAIANSRYAGSIKATSRESVMKPVHDEVIADFRAAFENLCSNIGRILKMQRADTDKEITAHGSMMNGLIKYLRV